MTQCTYQLTFTRSKAWNFLTMLGKRIGNAVPRYNFRVWAHYAGIVHKPSWCSVRGPATREICYRHLHEKGAVRILNVTVEAAIATDIATMMAQRADEMEHAAFANDSNKVATIIKSYQRKLPRRQAR